MKKTPVDFDQLFGALDGSDYCFINLHTGAVIEVKHDDDWSQDEVARMSADARTFARLDTFPSKVAFGVMEDFVKKLEPRNPARKSLTEALRGEKPFRKFKDALDNFEGVPQRWQEFKRHDMKYWVAWWVRKNAINVDVVIAKEELSTDATTGEKVTSDAAD